jgi:hypothetical protein
MDRTSEPRRWVEPRREGGSRRRRRRKIGAIALALASLALAAVLVPSGSASPPSSAVKDFDACLQYNGSPDCSTTLSRTGGTRSSLPGGAVSQLTLTIYNDQESNTTIGSANVDAPANIQLQYGTSYPVTANGGTPSGLVGAGSSSAELRLRNLNIAPNTSWVFTFYVQTACAGSGLQWNIYVKQSNDFSGKGNDFAKINTTGLTSDLTGGGCKLAFLTQPAETQAGSTITDQQASTGGPIVVGLEDSNGNRLSSCPVVSCSVTMTDAKIKGSVNGSFSGGAAVQMVNDSTYGGLVAKFATLSIGSIPNANLPETFTLHADAGSGITAADSSQFDIALSATDCSSGCSINHLPLGGSGDSVLDFSTSSNLGYVILNPNAWPYTPTNAPAGCENFNSLGVAGFAETDGRRSSTGYLTITYYVNKKMIEARYGKNVGTQFIPICVAAMPVVNGESENCYDAGGTVGSSAGGWVDDVLDASGKFTGTQSQAVCNGDGYDYGILGSFQDKIDQTQNPVATAWNTTTIGGTNYRWFQILVPPAWDLRGNS